MIPNMHTHGPWNHGIESAIPSRLMHRATLFDPRNSNPSWEQARELSDVTGLAVEELAAFRAKDGRSAKS